MVINNIDSEAGLLGRPSGSSSRTAPPTTTWPRCWRRVSVGIYGGVCGRWGCASAACRLENSTSEGPVTCTWEKHQKAVHLPQASEERGCHPLIFCTGPVAAQQVEPFFPVADGADEPRRVSSARLAECIWPHTMNEKLRTEVVTDRGGGGVRSARSCSFPARSRRLQRVVADIMLSGAEVVFNTDASRRG